MDETWRVATLTPTAPAHLIAYERDGVRATACNWVLPNPPGVLITRAEMLARCKFACTCCLGKAARR